MYKFQIYVTNESPKSLSTLKVLREFLDKRFKNQYSLEVIDVLTDPQAAEDNRIIATPTLVKLLPEPIKKLVGDLTKKEMLLLALDFSDL